MVSLPFLFKDIVMKLVRTLLIGSLFLMACSLFAPLPPTPILSLPSPELTAPPPQNETVSPLPTITPNLNPTNPPAVTLSAAEFTSILYRDTFSQFNEFWVIGGVQDGAWLPAEVMADQVQYEQAYELYANGYAGLATTKDNGAPPSPPRCAERTIGSDYSTNVPHVIGVEQGWDVIYRPWREIAVDTPVYYGAVADWLLAQGFTLPVVEIDRILLVDLEGDGVDEVFISASHFEDASGHMAEQGDYSILLMRKLVGAEVVTVPVVADLYTSPTAEQVFPLTYLLGNLLDLNQDGVLDLIVAVERWEGNGVILYEVEGTSVAEVLRSICTQ